MQYLEMPILFGNGGRLLGIATIPAEQAESPLTVVLFLNAGLAHRVGPRRIHVTLARRLAVAGVASLRVDLSGKGDSPVRDGLSNQQSVAADYAAIRPILDDRFKSPKLVLFGICSGADNAVRLAIDDDAVHGLILLDPISPKDPGWGRRDYMRRYTDPKRYANRLKKVLDFSNWATRTPPPTAPPLDLRDLPETAQTRESFAAVGRRGGHVLSVFTSYARDLYYNRLGQLERVLHLEAYASFCEERYWPETDHTFSREEDRKRLQADVVALVARTDGSRARI